MTGLRYPPAAWLPLPEADQQPSIVPTQVIDHTVVGHGSPRGGFNRPGNGKESHLWLSMDGRWEQYVSLDRSADANYHANRRRDGTGAISVETEDNGPATIQDTPWTPRQVEELAAFKVWCNSPEGLAHAWMSLHGTVLHPIPLDLCETPSSPGNGFHTLFGAPSEWTPVAKSCPGRARKAQHPMILDLARSMVAAAHFPFIPQEDDEVATTFSRPSAYQNIFIEPYGGTLSKLPAGVRDEDIDVFDHRGRLTWLVHVTWGLTVQEAIDQGLLVGR